jgi:hypothetical protein
MMAFDCPEWFIGMRRPSVRGRSVRRFEPVGSPNHVPGKDVPQYPWIFSIIHEQPLHIASDESTFLFFGATDRSLLLPEKSVLSCGGVVIMAVRNKV